jgi:hypothetical protein
VDSPRVSQEDVDDQGVNDQISRLRGLEPGEFNWAEEYDKIRGNIDSKAGALSRRRRDAMNKGTPDFKEPTSVDDIKNPHQSMIWLMNLMQETKLSMTL